MDLTAGTATVTRTWDSRAKKFIEPKTAAGNRAVALSGWVVAELTAHKERTKGAAEGLAFANRNGNAMNPSNVRRDVWLPLRKRAKVREFDLYSLRHTFASLGRTSGESAFNVSLRRGTRARRWSTRCTRTACSQVWRAWPSESPRSRSASSRSCV